MKTKELWLKRQNSGIENNPIITDSELLELKNRLEDIYEFLEIYNPILLGLSTDIVSMEIVLESRKRK